MEELPSSAAAVIAYKLTDASSWWNDVNESLVWQDRIFHILAALYGFVAAVALVLFAACYFPFSLSLSMYIRVYLHIRRCVYCNCHNL